MALTNSRLSMKEMDWMSRVIPVNIVVSENMVAVCTTRPHFMPFLRLEGLSNASIHWKKRTMTMPSEQTG